MAGGYVCVMLAIDYMNSRAASVSEILRPMPELSHTVSLPRQLLRLSLGFLILVIGLVIVGLVFPFLNYHSRMWAVRCWSRLFNLSVGLRVKYNPIEPPKGAALVVANHISWIDIFVIDTWHPCRFVAKSEINHWPVIGWLCRHTGTLFISRQRRHDTGRIRHQMVHGLERGHTLGVFPEGTTSDGSSLLPFNPSLLQAAIDTNSPVYSIHLRYVDAEGKPTLAAAYIDEMSLGQSIRQIVQARGLTAELHISPAIENWEQDRRALSQQCFQIIAASQTTQTNSD